MCLSWGFDFVLGLDATKSTWSSHWWHQLSPQLHSRKYSYHREVIGRFVLKRGYDTFSEVEDVKDVSPGKSPA
jgi:hypothetical protein